MLSHHPLVLARRWARAGALLLSLGALAACGGPGPADLATGPTGTTAGITGDGGCGADTWSNYGQAFFANNCGGCHNFDSSQSLVQSNTGNISARIQSGQMPPAGGLSSADVSRVVAYLSCGAP